MDTLIQTTRDEISDQLASLKEKIAESKPPVVQELVLAQRALEDARMRLGVAQAYENGLDPWASQVKKEEK